MKNLFFLILIIFLCRSKLIAQQGMVKVDNYTNPPGTELLKTDNAIRYLNKNQNFVGIVHGYAFINNSKSTVLYLNGNYPNQKLAIIIVDNSSPAIKQPEANLLGNYIFTGGLVTLFKGKPAIKISRWNDISYTGPQYKQPLQFVPEVPVSKYYKPLSGFDTDTTGYFFDNFLFHQNFYRNKPLSVLLAQIELPVKGYLYMGANKTQTKFEAINLEFDKQNDLNKDSFKKMPAVLRIFFKQQPAAMRLKMDNQKSYTSSLLNYYGRQIIDSISYWHISPNNFKLWKRWQ